MLFCSISAFLFRRYLVYDGMIARIRFVADAGYQGNFWNIQLNAAWNLKQDI